MWFSTRSTAAGLVLRPRVSTRGSAGHRCSCQRTVTSSMNLRLPESDLFPPLPPASARITSNREPATLDPVEHRVVFHFRRDHLTHRSHHAVKIGAADALAARIFSIRSTACVIIDTILAASARSRIWVGFLSPS